MKTFKRLLLPGALVGLAAFWFRASDSTRRYLVYIGKQIPSMPYRYFI